MRYKLSTIGNDYSDGGDGDSDSESINTAAAAADAVASGLSYDLISHLLLISCIYIYIVSMLHEVVDVPRLLVCLLLLLLSIERYSALRSKSY